MLRPQQLPERQVQRELREQQEPQQPEPELRELRELRGPQQPEPEQPGSCCSSIADESQNLANLCVLILGDADLEQGTCYGEGTSVSTLSVETSTRGSSASTCSPTSFQPAGNGALGDGLAQCGQYDLDACSSGGGSSGGCSRSPQQLPEQRRVQPEPQRLPGSRERGAGTVANDSQSSADLDVLVPRGRESAQQRLLRGGNLGVNLVGGNLNQGVRQPQWCRRPQRASG